MKAPENRSGIGGIAPLVIVLLFVGVVAAMLIIRCPATFGVAAGITASGPACIQRLGFVIVDSGVSQFSVAAD